MYMYVCMYAVSVKVLNVSIITMMKCFQSLLSVIFLHTSFMPIASSLVRMCITGKLLHLGEETLPVYSCDVRMQLRVIE